MHELYDRRGNFAVFPVGFPYYLQKAKSPYRRGIPLRVAALVRVI